MAGIYNVNGPTLVQVCIEPTDMAGAGTYVDLGWTPNDELLSFQVEEYGAELTSTDRGDAPAEKVTRGMSAIIPMTLNKWDYSTLQKIQTRFITGTGATTNEARFASSNIGKLFVGTSSAPLRCIAIRLTPSLSGARQYQFNLAWLMPEGVRQFNMGNEEKRLGLVFRAIPDGNGDVYVAAAV